MRGEEMITGDTLNKRYKFVLFIEVLILILFAYAIFFYQPNYYRGNIALEDSGSENRVTSNTVRISGDDFYKVSNAISQIAYPSTFLENRPNAIIIVRDDKIADGMLATRLIHHPINAPILFVKKDSIPDSTMKEIDRLNPRGVFADGNIKIIVIGDIEENVVNTIRKKGIAYRHIKGKDAFQLSINIDDYLAAIHGDHKDVVVIAPIDKPEHALSQVSWNAYSGQGFFFVEKDKIPDEVEKVLKGRYGSSYMYILGDYKLISKEVERELTKYGHVQRIQGGQDQFIQSISLASYRDVGKNFAWWFGKRTRDFGWGIRKPGNNFIFVNWEDWQMAVASSILSYKGKQGPMLLVEKDNIPDKVIDYLKAIKPNYSSPQEILSNHGWIIGSQSSISNSIQDDIDKILEVEGADNSGNK